MSKVEVWSYDQITNPEFKTEIAKTICDTNGLVDLQLSDGTIRVSILDEYSIKIRYTSS